MVDEQQQTRFRICTEDVHPTDDRLSARGITPDVLMASWFDSFTRYAAVGHWNGTQELSVIFEVIGPRDLKDRVLTVAQNIQEGCGQEVVLVTAEPVTTYFLTGE